jgi:hypothetical protein
MQFVVFRLSLNSGFKQVLSVEISFVKGRRHGLQLNLWVFCVVASDCVRILNKSLLIHAWGWA